MKKIFFILNLFVISTFGVTFNNNVRLGTTYGNQNIVPLITNGTRATLGQFPYQVAITMNIGHGDAVCGGTLIKHGWVLTSGHCLLSVYTNYRVNFAVLNAFSGPFEWRSGFISRDNIHPHPEFDVALFRNNIGLIRVRDMPETLLNSPNIGIIERPNDSEVGLNLVGRVGTTSGYGRTSDGVITWDPILYYTTHTIVSNDVCRESFGTLITDRNLCVDTTTGGSPCASDAGGPMTIEINPQRRILVGIVGVTNTNCTLGYPAVFESVLFHREWIDRTMNGSSMIGVSFGVIAAAIMVAVKNSM